MSNQCPVIVKPSRRKGAIKRLCRFLALIFGAVMSRKQEKQSRKYRSSNALYYLNRHQLDRLISAGKNERDRLILRTFIETGMRRFELAALQVEDIDKQNIQLRVKMGKGQKPRIIPLTKGLLSALVRLIGKRTMGAVFVSRKGGFVSVRQLNRIVSAAGKRAGIHNPNPKRSNVTCHLLRHSFARLWKEKGGDIEILSLIMGHSSVKTTYDSYARFGLGDIKRQYRKLFGNGEKS